METTIKNITTYTCFLKRLKEIKEKMGKHILTDDDLFVLMCEKIIQSYTYEEKDYQ